MKLRALFILACSVLSLASCTSNTEVTTSSNETEVSYTESNEETSSNDEETLEESEENQSEEPQLEPVIALSCGDYEFDISNMTYRDFLAFLQEIGYPASAESSGRQMELEPYEYEDSWSGAEAKITVGDTTVPLLLEVYNPTGEKITALDARIATILNLTDINDNNLKILGVNASLFSEYDSDYELKKILDPQLGELGYTRDGDYEYTKTLSDGRIVTFNIDGSVSITPVYDYGTY